MRKLVYALTATAAIAAGIPTLANANEVVIHSDRGYYGHRYDGPRFRLHDREFRHGFYHRDHDRDVVIREHRDYY